MRAKLSVLLVALGQLCAVAVAQQNPQQQPSEEAVVRKLSELQFHQGHGLACLAGARETGDAKGPSVSLVKWDPGCVIPWHWHTPNENVLVLEGVLQQDWRDRESAITKHGDFIHIPSHQVNRPKCISETPCMILLYSDSPWDMHFVDASGNEISVEQAVAAEAKVTEHVDEYGGTLPRQVVAWAAVGLREDVGDAELVPVDAHLLPVHLQGAEHLGAGGAWARLIARGALARNQQGEKQGE